MSNMEDVLGTVAAIQAGLEQATGSTEAAKSEIESVVEALAALGVQTDIEAMQHAVGLSEELITLIGEAIIKKDELEGYLSSLSA